MRSGSKTFAAQVKLDDAQCVGWNGTSMRPGGRGPCKVFDLHESPIAVGRKGLTGAISELYIGLHSGRLGRSGLAESPNGPFAGLSPELMEPEV